MGFLEQVLVDLAVASRVKNFFLDLGMDRKLEADPLRKLLLASFALRIFEFLEELLDGAVIFLQQRDRILGLGLSHEQVLPLLQSETNSAGWMFLGICITKRSRFRPARVWTGRVSAISSRSSASSSSEQLPGPSRMIRGGTFRHSSSAWPRRSSAWRAGTRRISTNS